MRCLMITGFVGVTLALAAFGQVSAAANPNGTGQPDQECGDDGATSEPNGFLTAGFAIAEAHYAGSEGTASAMHAHSEHAVSQYDVACYQHTQNGH